MKSSTATRVRRELELAALEAGGEAGYRALTVQRILGRGEVGRARFYKSFADKEDCYAQGYAVAIERLERDVIAPSATAPNWLAGFRAGLEALADFSRSEPLLARGLLAEVHVAGGAAMAKRKEVFERISRAIDAARRENRSRHSPPPITASFILNAIEAAAVRTFIPDRSQDFAASIPSLVYIAARSTSARRLHGRRSKATPSPLRGVGVTTPTAPGEQERGGGHGAGQRLGNGAEVIAVQQDARLDTGHRADDRHTALAPLQPLEYERVLAERGGDLHARNLRRGSRP